MEAVMITPGEVESVRELKRGVQARVCLGSSVRHGSAVVVFESEHPEVLAALTALKRALAKHCHESVGAILEDQRAWDEERTG
jgi:hypothetical protein